MPSVRDRLVVVCVCVAIFVDCFFSILGIWDFPFGVCGSCSFLGGVCMSCTLPFAGSTAASTKLVACPSHSLNVSFAGYFPFAVW